MVIREVQLSRKTKETQINIGLDMDQRGDIRINSPVPFFNHLLESMAFHGGFRLTVDAAGDTEVDPHHLIEDVGLVLGDLLYRLVNEHGGVKRFGHAVIPMDEALSEVTVDVCGRPTLSLITDFPQEWVGDFDCALVREFLQALSSRARVSLHAEVRRGENSHHMVESLFKALGKVLKQAYTQESDTLSTKGTILK